MNEFYFQVNNTIQRKTYLICNYINKQLHIEIGKDRNYVLIYHHLSSNKNKIIFYIYYCIIRLCILRTWCYYIGRFRVINLYINCA